jgi:hypothetical protein
VSLLKDKDGLIRISQGVHSYKVLPDDRVLVGAVAKPNPWLRSHSSRVVFMNREYI